MAPDSNELIARDVATCPPVAVSCKDRLPPSASEEGVALDDETLPPIAFAPFQTEDSNEPSSTKLAFQLARSKVMRSFLWTLIGPASRKDRSICCCSPAD